MSKENRHDTSEDVRLGRKLYNAMNEDKVARYESKRAWKVARYIVGGIIIIAIILCILFMSGVKLI